MVPSKNFWNQKTLTAELVCPEEVRDLGKRFEKKKEIFLNFIGLKGYREAKNKTMEGREVNDL